MEPTFSIYSNLFENDNFIFNKKNDNNYLINSNIISDPHIYIKDIENVTDNLNIGYIPNNDEVDNNIINIDIQNNFDAVLINTDKEINISI